MPEVRVVQPHTLSPDEARERLGGFRDLLARYKVKLKWSGDRATIGGVPGVSGNIHVRERAVHVVVKLSRMITMMGLDPSRLEGTIKRRLMEAFGP